MTSSFQPDYLSSYAEADRREQDRMRRANQPAEQMQQYVDKWKGEEAQKAGDDLLVLSEALDPKGPTGRLVADIIKGREKRIEAKADQDFRERRLTNNLSSSEQNTLDNNVALEEELVNEDKASSALSAQVLEKTGDFTLAEMIRESSGYRKLYLSKKYLKLKSQEYGEWISDRFRNDNRELQGPSGVFRINDPDLHPVNKAAALGILNREFTEANGLGGFDKMFLYDNFYNRKDGKGTDQQDNQFLINYKKQRSVDKGYTNRQNTFTNMWDAASSGGQVDLGHILTELRTTIGPKGGVITRAGAWQLLREEVARVAKFDADGVNALVAAISNSPDPQHKGKKVKDARPQFIKELEDIADNAFTTEINEDKAKLKAQGTAIEVETQEKVIELLESDASPEAIKELVLTQQKEYQKLGVGESAVIAKLWTDNDEDSQELLKMLQREALSEPTGKIPYYKYSGLPVNVLLEAKKKGLLMTKDETMENEDMYQAGIDGIEDDLQNALNLTGQPGDDTSYLFRLGKANAERDYRRTVQALILQGVPREQAYQQAAKYVQDKFRLSMEGGKKVMTNAPTIHSPYFQQRAMLTPKQLAEQATIRADLHRRLESANRGEQPLLNPKEAEQFQKWKDGKGPLPEIIIQYAAIANYYPRILIHNLIDSDIKPSEGEQAIMSTTDATYTPLKQLTTKGGGNPIETLNVLEPVLANGGEK